MKKCEVEVFWYFLPFYDGKHGHLSEYVLRWLPGFAGKRVATVAGDLHAGRLRAGGLAARFGTLVTPRERQVEIISKSAGASAVKQGVRQRAADRRQRTERSRV